MHLETQVLSKIQQQYKALIAHPNQIQNIRRDIPISDFSSDEILFLDELLDSTYINLLLNITFKDLNNHTEIEIKDDITYTQTIKQNPSHYSISKITFNHIDAFIWLSLYFQEDIDELVNETLKKNKTDQLKQIFFSILSIIGILLCGYLLSIAVIWSSKLYLFIVVVIASLSGHYLWNTYIPKSRKKHDALLNEQKFLVQEYLLMHFNIFASQYLKLDDI